MYCSVHAWFGLCSVILGICVNDTTFEFTNIFTCKEIFVMKNVSLYLARAQIRNYPSRECDHPFCKHVIFDRHSIFFTRDLA